MSLFTVASDLYNNTLTFFKFDKDNCTGFFYPLAEEELKERIANFIKK